MSSLALRTGSCAVVLGAAAGLPLLVSDDYALFMINLALINAIVAAGLNVGNGFAGLLNLSVAGQLALGAYGCALFALHGVPLPLAITLACGLGAAVAALTFLLLGRLSGFFFGLATISVSEIIRLLMRNLDDVTNGVRGLRGFPPLAASPAHVYWLLLGTLAAILVAIAVTLHTSVGLNWRAIRDNPIKAASLGVPVRAHRMLAFTVSGAIMSLGGAFLGLHLQYIEPGIAGLNNLVQTILMVALGGAGTLLGPVFGALTITVIPEALRAANELRLVLYGLTLIVVVLLVPGGVFGLVRERLHHRQARLRRLAREEALL